MLALVGFVPLCKAVPQEKKLSWESVPLMSFKKSCRIVQITKNAAFPRCWSAPCQRCLGISESPSHDTSGALKHCGALKKKKTKEYVSVFTAQ